MRPHVIRGEFKTIVAAVGEERGRPDLRLLEALETVESVMPVQQPFKLASREVRREPERGAHRRRSPWAARPSW